MEGNERLTWFVEQKVSHLAQRSLAYSGGIVSCDVEHYAATAFVQQTTLAFHSLPSAVKFRIKFVKTYVLLKTSVIVLFDLQKSSSSRKRQAFRIA